MSRLVGLGVWPNLASEDRGTRLSEARAGGFRFFSSMMNEILSVMSAHRSVRAFLPDPVQDEDISRAVAAARQAATSSWVQAYSLLQVTDPERREKLAEWTGEQDQVAEAGAFFVLNADVRRHRLVARRLEKPYAGNLEAFMVALIDASLFAQNLALAFESMGYGVCFIGGLRTRLPEVDALLELPDGVWPLFGICVGRPDPAVETEVRPRLPVEAIWMTDHYLDDGSVLDHIEAFDEVAARHYGARGLDGRNWSGGLWRKFAKPMREHLLEYYTGKGAELR